MWRGWHRIRPGTTCTCIRMGTTVVRRGRGRIRSVERGSARRRSARRMRRERTSSDLNTSGYNVYMYTDGDNSSATRTGTYQISGAGISTTTISATDASGANFNGTFVQANNSSGNYVVFTVNAAAFTLKATPGSSSDANPRAPLNGIQIVPLGQPSPDFTFSASPSSEAVNPGGNTSYTVSVGALNGFSGTVVLSVSGLPTGATAAFSPTTVSGAGSSTLTVTTTTGTTGNATLTITGTSGALTHTTTVTLGVAGFTVTGTPGTVSVAAGGSAS